MHYALFFILVSDAINSHASIFSNQIEFIHAKVTRKIRVCPLFSSKLLLTFISAHTYIKQSINKSFFLIRSLYAI